jgi:hypothetical protein
MNAVRWFFVTKTGKSSRGFNVSTPASFPLSKQETSRSVTQRHGTSRNVTECHGTSCKSHGTSRTVAKRHGRHGRQERLAMSRSVTERHGASLLNVGERCFRHQRESLNKSLNKIVASDEVTTLYLKKCMLHVIVHVIVCCCFEGNLLN